MTRLTKEQTIELERQHNLFEREKVFKTYHIDIINAISYLQKHFHSWSIAESTRVDRPDCWRIVVYSTFRGYEANKEFYIKQTLDVNDKNFWHQYDDLRNLNAEIDQHKEYVKQQDAVAKAKTQALAKLTPDERKLLGI
jgi:hypothetical protein